MQSVVLTKEKAFAAKSINDLRKITPSVFTKSPSKKASKEYNHISTTEVLERMDEFGWQINRATEIRPKKKENFGYQKHIIHLRNSNVFIGQSDQEIEMLPEIVLINSHDARSSFKVRTGLFRGACGNGLLIPICNMQTLDVPHRGSDSVQLKYTILCLMERIPIMMGKVDRLMQRQLTRTEKVEIAKDALLARWNYRYTAPIRELIEPLRDEDRGDNLWILFNVLQEKLIRGNWNGSDRKIKAIVDQNRELNINNKLFTIIESYL